MRKPADNLTTLGTKSLSLLCLCFDRKWTCLGNDDFGEKRDLMRFYPRKRDSRYNGAFACHRNNRSRPFEMKKSQTISHLPFCFRYWIYYSWDLQSWTSLLNW